MTSRNHSWGILLVMMAMLANASADPPASAAASQRAVPSVVQIDAAIRRGVDFLIADQNPCGSWGGPTRTKGLNIYAPLPGAHHAFQAGASGLALSGLIDSKDHRPEATAAIRRSADWIMTNLPKLRRADQTTTYNVWGHAYGLRAITRLHRMEASPEKRLAWANLAQEQIARADRYEDVNGGWGYLDVFDDLATRQPSGIPTPFTTATLLLAMHEAEKEMNLKLDDRIVQRSLNAIRITRTPDFSYGYSFMHRYAPRADINRPAGSLARSQACNACLRAFGDERVTDAVLLTWSDRFLEREGFLSNVRKRPVPHEGAFRIAGYFYYYGIFYFTESVRFLPADQHARFASELAAILLERQEKDGSWWDYPLYDYHQPYGTGYALMALSWCRDVLAGAG